MGGGDIADAVVALREMRRIETIRTAGRVNKGDGQFRSCKTLLPPQLQDRGNRSSSQQQLKRQRSLLAAIQCTFLVYWCSRLFSPSISLSFTFALSLSYFPSSSSFGPSVVCVDPSRRCQTSLIYDVPLSVYCICRLSVYAHQTTRSRPSYSSLPLDQSSLDDNRPAMAIHHPVPLRLCLYISLFISFLYSLYNLFF